jgi:hypothetical protein
VTYINGILTLPDQLILENIMLILTVWTPNIFICAFLQMSHIYYSNPSVYEQSVYEFSLIQYAQINICFSIY